MALIWGQQGQSLCLPGPSLQTPTVGDRRQARMTDLARRRVESKPMEQHQREALCGEIALFSDNDIVAGMA